jgi:hypothetical protein
MYYGPERYEHQGDEGPEAQMAREIAARDERRKAAMEQAIRDLHASLPEKSSDFELFTFAEVKQWGLKHTRKRSRGMNNDHEDDGA